MYRESPNSQEKKITKQLVVKFNKMLNSGVYIYFDSIDIEKIIDYYIEKKNEKKIQYAFNLYEKIYGHHSLILSKKDSIFGKKEGFSFPFTVKFKAKSLVFLKVIVVLVKQLVKVKLIEGLVGI